jgi:hypothetical protein
MLSRAELYRHGSYPCYKCEEFPGIDATTGDWCPRCKGTGFKSFELYEKGEVTAYPTAEVVEARGYEPNHAVLQKYGRISRRLDAVRAKLGSAGVEVLEAFYGDVGMRWGRTKHGRLFSLYPRTKAGKKLLEKTRAKERDNDPLTLSACERLGVQAELQGMQPKGWRRELMDAAAKQAEELHLEATLAFCSTAEKKKNKDPGRVKTKQRRRAEAWADGTPGAKSTGLSFDEIKEAAGFS